MSTIIPISLLIHSGLSHYYCAIKPISESWEIVFVARTRVRVIKGYLEAQVRGEESS